MDCRQFETSQGPVPVWGALDRFRPERPGLLVIRGAFPEPTLFFGLPAALPDADVALVDLPGMHSPFFSESRPEVFASAFDQVVRQVFPAPPVALGMSMGGLAAFAMSTTRGTIALDTPLSTAGLWPLRRGLINHARVSPALSDWVWQMFGVGPEDPSLNRDYRPLLAKIAAPARLLVGDEPLGEPRPVSRIPSLVAEGDRKAYAACPMVRLTDVLGAGHNIAAAATGPLLRLLREEVMASAA